MGSEELAKARMATARADADFEAVLALVANAEKNSKHPGQPSVPLTLLKADALVKLNRYLPALKLLKTLGDLPAAASSKASILERTEHAKKLYRQSMTTSAAAADAPRGNALSPPHLGSAPIGSAVPVQQQSSHALLLSHSGGVSHDVSIATAAFANLNNGTDDAARARPSPHAQRWDIARLMTQYNRRGLVAGDTHGVLPAEWWEAWSDYVGGFSVAGDVAPVIRLLKKYETLELERDDPRVLEELPPWPALDVPSAASNGGLSAMIRSGNNRADAHQPGHINTLPLLGVEDMIELRAMKLRGGDPASHNHPAHASAAGAATIAESSAAAAAAAAIVHGPFLLRRDAQEGRDFVLVGEEVMNALVMWWGMEGPPLLRKVDVIADGDEGGGRERRFVKLFPNTQQRLWSSRDAAQAEAPATASSSSLPSAAAAVAAPAASSSFSSPPALSPPDAGQAPQRVGLSEAAEEEEKVCATCGDPSTTRCGKCHAVKYCSARCQKSHWPTHKAVCAVAPVPGGATAASAGVSGAGAPPPASAAGVGGGGHGPAAHGSGSSASSSSASSVPAAAGAGSSHANGGGGSSGSSALSPSPGPDGGVLGLQNIGNTCFMNASLQALSASWVLTSYILSDKWKEDLNPTNPLGSGGKLAIAYAELIRKLWFHAPGARSVTPTDFKRAISRFKEMFQGFGQHDAQELMQFVLDGLHEDLNRVLQKPYVEDVDEAGRPDSEASAAAWERFLARNRSVVVDYFAGQQKSSLVCPRCARLSVKFDPYTMLTLPLPAPRRHFAVCVQRAAYDASALGRWCVPTLAQLVADAEGGASAAAGAAAAAAAAALRASFASIPGVEVPWEWTAASPSSSSGRGTSGGGSSSGNSVSGSVVAHPPTNGASSSDGGIPGAVGPLQPPPRWDRLGVSVASSAAISTLFSAVSAASGIPPARLLLLHMREGADGLQPQCLWQRKAEIAPSLENIRFDDSASVGSLFLTDRRGRSRAGSGAGLSFAYPLFAFELAPRAQLCPPGYRDAAAAMTAAVEWGATITTSTTSVTRHHAHAHHPHHHSHHSQKAAPQQPADVALPPSPPPQVEVAPLPPPPSPSSLASSSSPAPPLAPARDRDPFFIVVDHITPTLSHTWSRSNAPGRRGGAKKTASGVGIGDFSDEGSSDDDEDIDSASGRLQLQHDAPENEAVDVMHMNAADVLERHASVAVGAPSVVWLPRAASVGMLRMATAKLCVPLLRSWPAFKARVALGLQARAAAAEGALTDAALDEQHEKRIIDEAEALSAAGDSTTSPRGVSPVYFSDAVALHALASSLAVIVCADDSQGNGTRWLPSVIPLEGANQSAAAAAEASWVTRLDDPSALGGRHPEKWYTGNDDAEDEAGDDDIDEKGGAGGGAHSRTAAAKAKAPEYHLRRMAFVRVAVMWRGSRAGLFDPVRVGSVTPHTPSWSSMTAELSAARSGLASTALSFVLEQYAMPEVLDTMNMWRCPTCKEDVQAVKTLQIYTTPRILIIHLKRFEARNALWRDKLEQLVAFPLVGLELLGVQPAPGSNPACAPTAAAADASSAASAAAAAPAPGVMYDCFSVVNHFGSMAFGHYTAFSNPHVARYGAANGAGTWVEFDDSNVHVIPEPAAATVVSPAAYILMYRRRK